MITIKIGIFPGGKLTEYVLESGSTVGGALATAGMSAKGYTIQVDGVNATEDTVLADTAKLLILTKQIKGN